MFKGGIGIVGLFRNPFGGWIIGFRGWDFGLFLGKLGFIGFRCLTFWGEG